MFHPGKIAQQGKWKKENKISALQIILTDVQGINALKIRYSNDIIG